MITPEDWQHIEKIAMGLGVFFGFWILSATVKSWSGRNDDKWFPYIALAVYGAMVLFLLYTGMSLMSGEGDY